MVSGITAIPRELGRGGGVVPGVLPRQDGIGGLKLGDVDLGGP